MMAKKPDTIEPGLPEDGDRLAAIHRGEIVRQAAKLAAGSGEDALAITEKFIAWLDTPRPDALAAVGGSAGLIALDAAVIEAAGRHEHLRGRMPANSDTVLLRADQFVRFIAASEPAAEPEVLV